MSNKRKADYWYSYRKVRSNVQQNLSAIYQGNDMDENQMPCSSVNKSGDFHPDLSEFTDSYSTGQHKESELLVHHENSVLSDKGPSQHRSISFNQQKDSPSSDTNEETFSENPPYVSDSDTDDDFDTDISLEHELCTWATANKITHTGLRELLSLLRRYHPSLPKDR